MFLRTETVVNEWPRHRNGKVYYYKRSKIVHLFRCDYCGVEYTHGTYYPAKRLTNDGGYSHYCTGGYRQAGENWV